jgi:hypothetical protein
MASIIKADNIQKVSDGSNIIKKCGSTTTIGSGACSPIVICGSTVTLGRCGGTVTLACGATQSGFGRTGTVDWCTTAKTAPFTGVSGNGYFVNTACGAVTVTLPATPTAGDIISIADYASTFQTNNVTLCNNSSKINGVAETSILNTKGQSITLVYVDGTRGWKNTMDSTSNVSGSPGYLVICGGTETTCGNYKIHTFTSDSTFTVTTLAVCSANNYVDYVVVAGGGSGGPDEQSGGGGAGGYRESYTVPISGCYTASPLALACGALPVIATTYPITIGAGGAATFPNTTPGNPGSNSVFSSITSAGGGSGGRGCSNTGGTHCGSSGGSGGGGGSGNGPGGTGNTPPVNPPQGQTGGTGGPSADAGPYGGGGGGAGAAGTSGCNQTAPGGIGVGTAIAPTQGTPGPTPGIKYFSGGGGGGGYSSPGIRASGGAGGGGAGGAQCGGAPFRGVSGTANTGGGGGGAYSGSLPSGYGSGDGGSGIVIIRYKFQ